ncbi:MAG: hypothetical protein NPIRA02_11470 [Nitrospirales bacterium]|nr:MAG: hypothetical protein NPIRA02_11470 [Nitrospirales bacterium]
MSLSIGKGGIYKTFVVASLIVRIVPGISAFFAIYVSCTAGPTHSIGNSFQEISRSPANWVVAAIEAEFWRAIHRDIFQKAIVPIRVGETGHGIHAEVVTLCSTPMSNWQRVRTDGHGRSHSIIRVVPVHFIHQVDRQNHQIIDFLRYAWQKPPDPKQISSGTLVKQALDQWYVQGQSNRIEVQIDCDPHLSGLFVDPEQIKESIVNLLMNVREAMSDGGDDERLILELADSGCGIPPAIKTDCSVL